VFNTINFSKSMHYNPFAYIHSEKDILKLVTTLIANTKGDGKSGDEFWTKAETLLYCALIGYIHYEAPVEEQNFATLIEFINAMEVREDDEEFQNPVDIMFENLEKRNPKHFAVRQYKKYKLMANELAGRYFDAEKILYKSPTVPNEVTQYKEPVDLDELFGDLNLHKLRQVFDRVMKQKDNRIDKVRSSKKVFQYIVDKVRSDIPNEELEKAEMIISYADNEEIAIGMKQEIVNSVGMERDKVNLQDIGPCIGVHTGPNSLYVFYLKRHLPLEMYS